MTRRSTRQRGFLAAAAMSTMLSATACGIGGIDSDPDVLRVMDYYNNQPDKAIYQEVLESCGRGIGMRIDRETVPGGDFMAKVLQQSTSRTLPDVLMLDNPELSQIASSGTLTPLREFDIDATGYQERVVAASTYQGELYGLQPVTNTVALFYNKDILAAAQVRPPTTWKELKSVAAQLTNRDHYGLAFSAINTYEGTLQFLPLMWSAGGSESDLASPQVADALQLWVDLVGQGSASRSVVNWTQADVNDQFAAGNAAMQINGPWQFPILDATAGLNYGVVPIPAPTAGTAVISPLGGETWTVPQTGDPGKQAKAAELVRCINSDANIVKLSTERNTIPTKPALVPRSVAAVPALAPFAEQLPDLRARTGELGTAWPVAATKIYTAVQNALVGGMSPRQALQQAQEG